MVGCPGYISAMLNRLAPLVGPMAKRLDFDEDFLITLAVHEHGWSDLHNDRLHNLFGTTHGGHANLGYDSDQAACDSWVEHYGGLTKGSRDINEFLRRLRSIGYNTKTPSYDSDSVDVFLTVKKDRRACNI